MCVTLMFIVVAGAAASTGITIDVYATQNRNRFSAASGEQTQTVINLDETLPAGQLFDDFYDSPVLSTLASTPLYEEHDEASPSGGPTATSRPQSASSTSSVEEQQPTGSPANLRGRRTISEQERRDYLYSIEIDVSNLAESGAELLTNPYSRQVRGIIEDAVKRKLFQLNGRPFNKDEYVVHCSPGRTRVQESFKYKERLSPPTVRRDPSERATTNPAVLWHMDSRPEAGWVDLSTGNQNNPNPGSSKLQSTMRNVLGSDQSA